MGGSLPLTGNGLPKEEEEEEGSDYKRKGKQLPQHKSGPGRLCPVHFLPRARAGLELLPCATGASLTHTGKVHTGSSAETMVLRGPLVSAQKKNSQEVGS